MLRLLLTSLLLLSLAACNDDDFIHCVDDEGRPDVCPTTWTIQP